LEINRFLESSPHLQKNIQKKRAGGMNVNSGKLVGKTDSSGLQ
jgi:hypothetical protein